MPEAPLHLRIFVSSPSDVAKERGAAREVIERLPHEPLLEGKLTMDAVMWDAPHAPVPLAATETPQASVNRYMGLASDCDLTVVILWSRIGTPLVGLGRKPDGTAYVSGTEFEFEDAAAHGRAIWVYHSKEELRPTNEDQRLQAQGVQQFIDGVRSRGAGINEYATSSAFAALFEKHLERFIRRQLEGDLTGSVHSVAGTPHWLWDVVVSSQSGSDAQGRLTVNGPAGPLYVTRESWPEFSDVRRSHQWFIGREEMIARVAGVVSSRASGYIQIVGGAGLGKSALAVELATRYRAPAYFVSAPAGRSVPAHVLEALCAQAIIRYGLPHRQLPAGAGESSEALLSLLGEAIAQPENRSIVVVVDGLDEADAPPRGRNWLNLPKAPPDGVFFVLLHRPGEFPLVVDPGVTVESFNLEDDPGAQRRDVEAYLAHEIARPEIAAAIGRSDPRVTPEALVRELAVASEGNFMYLSYVLADIAASPSGPHLDTLPKGLDGYYGNVWTQMSESKTTDRTTWKSVQRPILALLAAAREPVSAEWLSHQSGVDADDVRELALGPWSRFLARSAHAPKWRVMHKSFGDFLTARSEIDLARTHRQIAEYYTSDIRRADELDSYAYRHLSVHLAEADLLDALGGLIEKPTWYRAQKRRDPSGQAYVLDVARAIALARAHGPGGLGLAVAWSVLHATVTTMASDVPIDALLVLVLLDRDELALAHAALITDPERRLEAQLRIGEMLLSRQRQEAAANAAVLAAGQMPQIWPGNRSQWTGPIASLLERAGRHDLAKTIVESSDSEEATAGAVEEHDNDGQVPAASKADTQDETQALIARITEAEQRIRAGNDSGVAIDGAFEGVAALHDGLERQLFGTVSGLIAHLAETGDQTGLDHLTAAVSRYKGPTTARILGLLAATYAERQQRDRALQLLGEAERQRLPSADRWVSDSIASELAVRAVQVDPRLLDKSFDKLDRLDGYLYSSGLASLAQELARTGKTEGLRRVLERVERVSEEYRPQLLGSLAAGFLTLSMESDVQKTMSLAEGIGEREPRLDAISTVALALAGAGHREAAQTAVDRVLAEAEVTPFSASEVRVLSEIAKSLEGMGRHDDALSALTVAEQMVRPEWGRVRQSLAEAVGKIRDRNEACASFDALITMLAQGDDPPYDSGRALGGLADSVATIGYAAGLTSLRGTVSSITYSYGRAYILTRIAAAHVQLHQQAEAASAFDDAIAALEGTDAKRRYDENEASTLSDWFDTVCYAQREMPTIAATLERRDVLKRALAIAKSVRDKDWGAQARAGAARVLALSGHEADAEKLLTTLVKAHPDEAATVLGEMAVAAVANAGQRKSSELFTAAIRAAERAIDDRDDLDRSLSAIVEAAGAAANSEAIDAVLIAARRLRAEAHALVLFNAAAARLKLRQENQARAHLDEALQFTRSADVKLTLDNAYMVGYRMRDILATIATPSDGQAATWLGDLFAIALPNGREDVLATIVSVAPVLERLQAIVPLWQHWQHVDTLLIRGTVIQAGGPAPTA